MSISRMRLILCVPSHLRRDCLVGNSPTRASGAGMGILPRPARDRHGSAALSSELAERARPPSSSRSRLPSLGLSPSTRLLPKRQSETARPANGLRGRMVPRCLFFHPSDQSRPCPTQSMPKRSRILVLHLRKLRRPRRLVASFPSARLRTTIMLICIDKMPKGH